MKPDGMNGYAYAGGNSSMSLPGPHLRSHTSRDHAASVRDA